jgi:hypothetical protein
MNMVEDIDFIEFKTCKQKLDFSVLFRRDGMFSETESSNATQTDGPWVPPLEE